MTTLPRIHRLQARAIPVNAYLIETANGVILVDSALAVSDGRAVRARIAELGKPLLGGIVTHAHPDHYGALSEIVGDERVPIVALEGVDDAIRRDDAEKERILRPMFGDEWAHRRMFPSETLPDHGSVTFDGVTLTVMDLGRGESPHDSLWVLEGSDVVLVGDLVYSHMHGYLADGFHREWLANIERARSLLPERAILHPGHGEPGSKTLLDWQAAYVRTFVAAVREAGSATPEEAVQAVTKRMKALLPSDDLLFLMQLSVPALQARLTADES